MPLYTDALLGDTLHLSVDEFGAYCLLLFATWRNNGEPLPDDDRKLARVCRVSDHRWKKLRPTLERFFKIIDGKWHQKRLEREWKYVQERAEVSRANGLKGGRPRNPAGIPDPNPAETQQQSTHTHTHGYIYNKYNNNLSAHAREGLPPETPWSNRCRAWAEGARWMPDWGPSPDEPGCWAPAKLVTEARKQRGGD
jgi:uncharacterized protein YdaU (DUF1376 family)